MVKIGAIIRLHEKVFQEKVFQEKIADVILMSENRSPRSEFKIRRFALHKFRIVWIVFRVAYRQPIARRNDRVQHLSAVNSGESVRSFSE